MKKSYIYGNCNFLKIKIKKLGRYEKKNESKICPRENTHPDFGFLLGLCNGSDLFHKSQTLVSFPTLLLNSMSL